MQMSECAHLPSFSHVPTHPQGVAGSGQESKKRAREHDDASNSGGVKEGQTCDTGSNSGKRAAVPAGASLPFMNIDASLRLVSGSVGASVRPAMYAMFLRV